LAKTSFTGSEIGTRGFDRPDQGDAFRLFNLTPTIDPSRRYSRVHRLRRELLDQIYSSVDLFLVDQNNDRRIPEVDMLFHRIKERYPLQRPKLYLPYREMQAITVL
jgi:hypothetical protein